MEIIPVGKKENHAPQLETPQVDGNGPDEKPNLALPSKKGQVASWDGNNLFSTLGDLGGCKANASHCFMADGVV
uniref:Prolactin receptor n=1 Tax=Romanomermis culicivorax TaxID=13658 RepID=A0A915K9F0_ROMCU